jgi:hypothetical protein
LTMAIGIAAVTLIVPCFRKGRYDKQLSGI